MPEFEPLTSQDRQLIGEPERPPPSSPRGGWRVRAGFAAALLLIGVAAVMSRSQSAPDTAAEPPAAAPSRPAAPAPLLPAVESPIRLQPDTVALDLPGQVVSFDVAPDGYAAVVATRCVTPSRCRATLGVSPDGARWTRRRLPSQVASESVTVWSLGGGVLVVELPRVLRLRSGDGGRTWKEVSLAPAEQVWNVSAGTVTVTLGQRPRRAPCAGQQVAVVRRDTGRTARLAHQPPRVDSCAVMAQGVRQDTLWAAGVDRETHQPVVAFSGDGGTGWATWPLPDFDGVVERVWLSIAGPHVYVTVFGPLGANPESFGVIAVYRRVVDGWVRTVRYTGPAGEINGMIACPDGMLLAVQQEQGSFRRPRQMVSYDHGRSWAVADSAVLVTVSNPTSPRGYGDRYAWAYTPMGRRGLVQSADCRTWRGLPVR